MNHKIVNNIKKIIIKKKHKKHKKNKINKIKKNIDNENILLTIVIFLLIFYIYCIIFFK
jgi:hypothetical protein